MMVEEAAEFSASSATEVGSPSPLAATAAPAAPVGVTELIALAATARAEWQPKAAALVTLFPEIPAAPTAETPLPMDVAAIASLTSALRQSISVLKRQVILSKVNGAGLEADLAAQPMTANGSSPSDLSVYGTEALADVPASCAANAVTELLHFTRTSSVAIVGDALAAEAELLAAPAARIGAVRALVSSARSSFGDDAEVREMAVELASQGAVEAQFTRDVAALDIECSGFDAQRDALNAACADLEARISERAAQARLAAAVEPAMSRLSAERCETEALHAWRLAPLAAETGRLSADFARDARCAAISGRAYTLVADTVSGGASPADDGSATAAFCAHVECVETTAGSGFVVGTKQVFTTFPGGADARRTFAASLIAGPDSFNVFGAAHSIASPDDFSEVRRRARCRCVAPSRALRCGGHDSPSPLLESIIVGPAKRRPSYESRPRLC